jgi:hypothetical protein
VPRASTRRAHSFDSLNDHPTLIASPLDVDDIQSTLDVRIEVITEALLPDDLQAVMLA